MAKRVTIKKADGSNKQPLAAKPLVEVTQSVGRDTGEDLYIVQGTSKHQFSSQVSPVYKAKEYYWKGRFIQNEQVQLVHKGGKKVPVYDIPNCGYTLVGLAKTLIKPENALVTNGDDGQVYAYINEKSVLTFVGESGIYTIFVRVYDNINHIDNDRWVVIYLE